jgi:hypothetical protein
MHVPIVCQLVRPPRHADIAQSYLLLLIAAPAAGLRRMHQADGGATLPRHHPLAARATQTSWTRSSNVMHKTPSSWRHAVSTILKSDMHVTTLVASSSFCKPHSRASIVTGTRCRFCVTHSAVCMSRTENTPLLGKLSRAADNFSSIARVKSGAAPGQDHPSSTPWRASRH